MILQSSSFVAFRSCAFPSNDKRTWFMRATTWRSWDLVISCDRACWKQLACELSALAVRPSVMLPARFLARGLQFVVLPQFASRPSAEALIQQANQQYFLVTCGSDFQLSVKLCLILVMLGSQARRNFSRILTSCSKATIVTTS